MFLFQKSSTGAQFPGCGIAKRPKMWFGYHLLSITRDPLAWSDADDRDNAGDGAGVRNASSIKT